MFWWSLLLLWLCNYVVLVVVHLSLCIHNYRWTRTKLPTNNKNNNNNKKDHINLHKFLNVQELISDVSCSLPYIVLMLTTRCLYQGRVMSALHLLKIWALEHWAMYVDSSVLLLLLFHVVVVYLSLCIHNSWWTITKLHSNNNNNNNNTNKKINLQKIVWSFCSKYLCCYCVILLLLFLFICSCGSTITDEEQQQHETVTTTTTTQSNIHKLLSVQELISPIHIPMYDLPLQQLKMKWANKQM